MRLIGIFAAGICGVAAMVNCSSLPGLCDEPGACGSEGGDGGVEGGVGKDGGVIPSDCEMAKDPKDSVSCVDESVGVFVSATGSVTGAGTRGSPVGSIGKGIEKAVSLGLKRVYVCAGNYAEAVVLSQGVSLYGGFSCDDWTYAGAGQRGKVAPSAVGFALEVRKSPGVVIADLDFESLAGTTVRPSSVTVLVSESTVRFARVSLKAGDGAEGKESLVGSNYDPELIESDALLAGHGAVDAGGGAEQECAGLCVNMESSRGGKGGNGGNAPTDGSPGKPALDGGAGGTVVVAGCGGTAIGGDGAVGLSRADGVASSVLGVLTASGWEPSGGGAGESGGPGQGGGGGGGKASVVAVGGGGGGGCGGCGGAGAAASGGGGGSIALASYKSEVRVESSSLTTGKGGKGGDGKAGQPGQVGGIGGVQTGGGCQGGVGGIGGGGGASAGGAGGISVGVLSTLGKDVSVSTDTTVKPGVSGLGGAGGKAGSPGNGGMDGRSQKTLRLP